VQGLVETGLSLANGIWSYCHSLLSYGCELRCFRLECMLDNIIGIFVRLCASWEIVFLLLLDRWDFCVCDIFANDHWGVCDSYFNYLFVVAEPSHRPVSYVRKRHAQDEETILMRLCCCWLARQNYQWCWLCAELYHILIAPAPVQWSGDFVFSYTAAEMTLHYVQLVRWLLSTGSKKYPTSSYVNKIPWLRNGLNCLCQPFLFHIL